MKNELNIYYDEEGDYLEINIGDYTEDYFKEIDSEVAEIINRKTNEVIGISIMAFKERMRKIKNQFISKKISLYYDDKKDYLEIYFGEIKKGVFKEIDGEIAEIINEKTNEVIGVSIMNFTKKTRKFTELKIPLKLEIIS